MFIAKTKGTKVFWLSAMWVCIYRPAHRTLNRSLIAKLAAGYWLRGRKLALCHCLPVKHDCIAQQYLFVHIFLYKFDILDLKAQFKILSLFYSPYRKPGSLFLMKPADSLMLVHVGVCVCVCLQSGRWVSYLQRSHTHPLLCLINTISEFQPSHMCTYSCRRT